LLSLLTCIQRSMGSELSSTAIMVSTGTSSRPANSIDSAGEAGSSRFEAGAAIGMAGASGSTSCQSPSEGNALNTSASSTGAAVATVPADSAALRTGGSSTAETLPPSTTRQTSGDSGTGSPSAAASRASIIADRVSVSMSRASTRSLPGPGAAPALPTASTACTTGDVSISGSISAPMAAGYSVSSISVAAGRAIAISSNPAGRTCSSCIATKSAVIDSISAGDRGRSTRCGASTAPNGETATVSVESCVSVVATATTGGGVCAVTGRGG